MDKIVTSIQEINLEDIRFPIIAVFEHPEDYPTKSVGIIFELTKPTDTVIVKDTLEELQKDIQTHWIGIFFRRTEFDVPSMKGCWV